MASKKIAVHHCLQKKWHAAFESKQKAGNRRVFTVDEG